MNVEDIQAICRGLPSVTEDIKWEHDLVFSIGGKMFCVVSLNQVPTTASFKVTEVEFEELSRQEGFKPAPYVARYKWVMIDDIRKMNKNSWKRSIEQSYDLVKDKLSNKIKLQLKL